MLKGLKMGLNIAIDREEVEYLIKFQREAIEERRLRKGENQARQMACRISLFLN